MKLQSISVVIIRALADVAVERFIHIKGKFGNIRRVMKEFNFNSQVCTDRNQSERLLALGLKKETADCTLIPSCDNDGTYVPK